MPAARHRWKTAFLDSGWLNTADLPSLHCLAKDFLGERVGSLRGSETARMRYRILQRVLDLLKTVRE